MGNHRNPTLEERETIMVFRAEGKTITRIAEPIGKDKGAVPRELKRNRDCKGKYIACTAQYKYHGRRRCCHRKLKLAEENLFGKVRSLSVDLHWSHEQISERMKLEEGEAAISANTIYRAIYRHIFDLEPLSSVNRGLTGKLRHRGKPRQGKGSGETGGKIRIPQPIDARPASAQNRSRRGHWEGDTVIGKAGRARLVTMVDGKSGFPLCGKAEAKASPAVGKKILEMLRGKPLLSITQIGGGKEFPNHEGTTKDLGVESFLPLPHHPWDGGTN